MALAWLRRRQDAAIAVAILLVSLVVYLLTLSPSVVVDDGGEFQMLSYVLGVAHPTGYPLALLLGWVFSHLPLGGDVALRVTLLSTVSSAVAMSLAYLLARQLGAGRGPAAMAALALAVAPRVWMHATAAEVYGLADIFIFLGLWLLVRWGEGKTRLWVVMLAFGFGLAHHINLASAWAGGSGLSAAGAPALAVAAAAVAASLGALLLPLLLYGLIPLRADYFLSQPAWQGDILGVHKAIASGLVSPHYFGGAAESRPAPRLWRPVSGWRTAGPERSRQVRGDGARAVALASLGAGLDWRRHLVASPPT